MVGSWRNNVLADRGDSEHPPSAGKLKHANNEDGTPNTNNKIRINSILSTDI